MTTIETTDNRTDEQRTQEQIIATLAELSDKRTGNDKIVKKGTRYQLPERTTLAEDIKTLVDYADGLEQVTTITNTFRYRPWDGAHAVQQTLLKVWGTPGRGVGQQSFFGSTPPEMKTVYTGPKSKIKVPWGSVRFVPMQAMFELGALIDRDYGLVFQLSITAPMKYAEAIDGLFKMIELELENNSIYKGKAFTGAEDPIFLDPYSVDKTKVVYSEEVATQLGALVWTTIRYPEACQAMNVSTKRATLLAGPYGTGKSLAAMLTAQVCVENGWTFLQCRPEDDLKRTLQTAVLYQPAVVFYEDVDTLTQTGDPETISKLLNMFDGIQAKGTQLAMVLTTNFEEKIHRGMLRPGRIDGLIKIGPLDDLGYVNLIKALVPASYLPHGAEILPPSQEPEYAMDAGGIDWTKIAPEMRGFLPAYVAEVAERAKLYQIDRTQGHPIELTTHDFLHAARGLRPQLELMEDAKTGITPDALGVAMEKVLAKVVTSGEIGVYDLDHDHQYTLAPVSE